MVKPHTPDGRRAFTLTELLVVIAVLAIFAVVGLAAYSKLKDRAARLNCTSNLKNLYAALAAHVNDHGQWPQCPYELGDEGYDEWWLKTMSAYTLGEKNWQCPSLRDQEEREAEKKEDLKFRLHYVPTDFDDEPSTPYKWPGQPWLIEIADRHGSGNLMIFSNGSVQGFNDFIGELYR